VAVALASIHRFNGGFGPSSVASHSLRVSGNLPPPLQLAGLVHDIGEVVTGDVPKPLKALAPELRALESRWREILLHHLLGYDLGREVDGLCEHHLVHEADSADYHAMLPMEQSRLRRLERLPAMDDSTSYDARLWAERFEALS
jgi:hypothetical protein